MTNRWDRSQTNDESESGLGNTLPGHRAGSPSLLTLMGPSPKSAAGVSSVGVVGGEGLFLAGMGGKGGGVGGWGLVCIGGLVGGVGVDGLVGGFAGGSSGLDIDGGGFVCRGLAGLESLRALSCWSVLKGVDPDAEREDLVNPFFWVAFIVVFAGDWLAS
jgi:hypothetical protein